MQGIIEAGIMEEGMECLTKHLGSLKAQMFVSAIIEDKFDYTKWRENEIEESPEKISHDISEWGKTNPMFMKSFGI